MTCFEETGPWTRTNDFREWSEGCPSASVPSAGAVAPRGHPLSLAWGRSADGGRGAWRQEAAIRTCSLKEKGDERTFGKRTGALLPPSQARTLSLASRAPTAEPPGCCDEAGHLVGPRAVNGALGPWDRWKLKAIGMFWVSRATLETQVGQQGTGGPRPGKREPHRVVCSHWCPGGRAAPLPLQRPHFGNSLRRAAGKGGPAWTSALSSEPRRGTETSSTRGGQAAAGGDGRPVTPVWCAVMNFKDRRFPRAWLTVDCLGKACVKGRADQERTDSKACPRRLSR